MNRQELQRLASIIKRRNAIDDEIATIIGRPSLSGHLGEFVASRIFGIRLAESAVTKGIDGRFAEGGLVGRSVNIKKYGLDQGLLDIRSDAVPDYYLVLTGPRSGAGSSRGTTQPWVIASIFLFEGPVLVKDLRERGLKIGVATSVRRQLWNEAEIYPFPKNPTLSLNAEQRAMVAMFA